MTSTRPRRSRDILVAELTRLVETGVTNAALADSPEVLAVAGRHVDATEMSTVRSWLRAQADAMIPPPDQPDRDYGAAIGYALGLTQGTLTWPPSDRFRRVADALNIARPSLTQKKRGQSPLTRLIDDFTTVIESAPVEHEEAVQAPSGQTSGIDFSAPQAAYEMAITEIDAVRGDPTVTIDVASLRSLHDARAARIDADYPAHVVALHEALESHVRDGGHVRRIVALTNLAQLEIECERQSRLREQCDPAFYELRAYVLDMTPGLAPLVIEGRCALLGMSDPAAVGVLKACVFRSTPGIDFCAKAFEGFWNDSRAWWLTTMGRGISQTELEPVRQEVRRLVRRRQADQRK
jgi:hypothetical protein